MDKTRESTRSFPKRKHGNIAVKESSEYGAVVLREVPSKIRRGSYSHRDKGEPSITQESYGNDDARDAGLSRICLSNTRLFVSDQNHRLKFTPARPLPRIDEVIGVVVPRKPRSASVKRTQESWSSDGGGKQQNLRRHPNYPGRQRVEPSASTSTSVSAQQKMKVTGAVAKPLKLSSSDMEIEIAELLFDLMTSKNHESSSQKVEATINPNTSMDADKKKLKDDNSTEEFTGVRGEQPADVGRHDGNATCHENRSSEVPKVDISDDRVNSGAGFDSDSAPERPLSTRWGSESCSKLVAIKQDSEATSNDKVEDKVEMQARVEKVPEQIEEAAKVVAFNDKLDVLKYNIDKQYRNKEQPTPLSNPKVEKTDHSSSVHLSTIVSESPSNLSPIGSITMIGRNTPPLQTVVKTNKTTGSSTTTQHPTPLSQPKRCATHYHIARNILHQKFTKMNTLLPAAIESGSLCATKTNNITGLLSGKSMVLDMQSQKHLRNSNQNGTQEKWLASTGDHNLTATKSSNNANLVDSTHRMQFVLQQGPHSRPTGNQVHGQAFLFASAHYQASVAETSNQAGGLNSPDNASSYNRSQSSVTGSSCASSTLPAAANAMTFSYPQYSTNNSPYATIVHNNGYSFPISTTSLGATTAIRGANSAQTKHILDGPLYSSQMFHPLQCPQQHPHSQALVQPSYLTAQTLSSSSSHMKSHGAQLNANTILTSTSAQRSQKQQTPQSHPLEQETEVNGKNVTSVANLTSYPLNNLQGKLLPIPVQPMNFSFKPCATSDIVGGNSGNFGDRQLQTLKGGVEVIPSQAFAVSFASFNETNLPSNLNFSSMKPNPLVIQSMPDVAQQGYQTASALHNVQQKTYSIAVEKRGVNSSHQDDEKKTTHGKSLTNGPTTLVFDNSSNNINFVLSPSNGSWPSHSVASTVITTMPFSSNTSSSQQSLQLQHQPSTTNRNKSSSTNTASATKFANSTPVLSQSHSQCKSSYQTSDTKITGRNPGSNVHHHTSSITSKIPTTKNVLEKGRFSHSHMQISFGGDYTTSLPSEVIQKLNNSQYLCIKSTGSSFSEANLMPNLDRWKIDSSVNASQLQQTENSSSGTGQKSSPVCGRNVPSILSSGPSQLSELK